MANMAMTPAEYLKRPYARVLRPESDGSFGAEILEFPGCFAVGDTGSEALQNLENVAESWILGVLAKNERVPDPLQDREAFSGKLVLRLPRSLHKKAAFAAEREGVSLNQFISACVAEAVGVSAGRAHEYQQAIQEAAARQDTIMTKVSYPEQKAETGGNVVQFRTQGRWAEPVTSNQQASRRISTGGENA
ncbi:MAG: type II toxin-antitoxin system HicB family antitoxin [Roseomonas sp.]|nr:type II toxin-antitoxin system HicB family antitoxin [Roseomonas sp.]